MGQPEYPLVYPQDCGHDETTYISLHIVSYNKTFACFSLFLQIMPRPPASLCGTVVSAGRMMKAVKVRTTKQVYNSFLKKVRYDRFLKSL